jgi:IS30 family transposase
MQKYTQLSQELRYQIYSFNKAGWTQCSIAKEIGVHQATISRELSRNKGKKEYSPKQAHKKSIKRKQQKRVFVKITESLKDRIVKYIRKKWSPDQISNYLKKKNIFISHESIYQLIIKDKKSGGKLYTHLRCQKKRKKRYGSIDRRGSIKNRVSIDFRPTIVDKRNRFGDWEADLIVGQGQKGYCVTLVERKTRFTIISTVSSKKAAEVRDVIIKQLLPYKESLKTITFDNGKEFALHEDIAKTLNIQCFFAHPYHSWERGTNENTNGLIRQYFKKNMSLDNLTQKDTQYVMNQLNYRPRKVIGFCFPIDLFWRHVVQCWKDNLNYALAI